MNKIEMLSWGYALLGFTLGGICKEMDPFQKAFLLVLRICILMAPLTPALKGTAVTLVVMGQGGGFCCFSFILAPGIAF